VLTEFDSPTSYNVFRAILNLVGFMAGGLVTGFVAAQGHTHCSK
jgi:hypothetical protein